MRKLMFLLITVLLIFVIAGCGGPKETVIEPAPKETVTEPVPETKEKEFTNVNWPEIIPDPETFFAEANVAIIMYDPTAYYQVKDYKDGDWEAYVDAAIEMGFTDIKHKSQDYGNKVFMAYDKNHEYYLEVLLNGENQLLDVICKVAEK